ncbi:hypothetical protein [Endozoicomonas sp. SCSIO W0465]|uniref:hypothetical protein n=1 Tax=Endozoicomonas sp. SCSIO W0465 TaxID=2918516 RepID=UPI002075861C|nr:hypothetical protein [Endozoicomonas sp. SCSIO W0465]USE38306.1 hypothetical protein MJO57_09150 [Endozoicomonas sp. SCSIO W0465]
MNVPHGSSTSESTQKKTQSDTASPTKSSWNGYDIFTTPPVSSVTVYSRKEESLHFNENLKFTTLHQREQSAITRSDGNPFIQFFGFKNEEHLTKAIAIIDLSEISDSSQQIQSTENPFFRFISKQACYKACYKAWFPPELLKDFRPTKELDPLAAKINPEVILGLDRHFHLGPIKTNLVPHEDPVACDFKDLPKTDGNQQNEMAYNCDYLFTNVRHVRDPALEEDHLCLYLAARGLGNTNAQHSVCANPELTNELVRFFDSINNKTPIALRLCKIDNKPGAGYAINQNSEYTFDIEQDSAAFQVMCRNNNRPQRLLFQRKLESLSPECARMVVKFKDGNKTNPIVFKVLHGYEIASTRGSASQAVTSQPGNCHADNGVKPSISREIMIGRLTVIPRKEELPLFSETKTTTYELGPKILPEGEIITNRPENC